MKLIPLTQNEFAVVDDLWFENLSKYRWHLDVSKNCKYARTSFKGKNIRMHRMIMGHFDGLVIDHVDGDGLNNTLRNLRFVTKSMNGLNRKNRKGYYFDKNKKKFICRVQIEGKSMCLGRFNEESEAILTNKKWIAEMERKGFERTAVVKNTAFYLARSK